MTYLKMYVIYVEAAVNTSGTTIPFAHETTGLYVIFAGPPKWQLSSNNRKCAIDILFSLRSWEFSSCFHMFPSCGWHLQKGFTAVPFPCATALLCMEESVDCRCSFRSYLTFVAAIRTSTFLRALSSPCVMENGWKSFCQERNAVTYTVSSRRWHSCSLEGNISA